MKNITDNTGPTVPHYIKNIFKETFQEVKENEIEEDLSADSQHNDVCIVVRGLRQQLTRLCNCRGGINVRCTNNSDGKGNSRSDNNDHGSRTGGGRQHRCKHGSQARYSDRKLRHKLQ